MTWSWRDMLEWRTRMGLTQAEAGEAIGRSRVMISNYEGGLWPVPPEIVLACLRVESTVGPKPKRMSEKDARSLARIYVAEQLQHMAASLRPTPLPHWAHENGMAADDTEAAGFFLDEITKISEKVGGTRT